MILFFCAVSCGNSDHRLLCLPIAIETLDRSVILFCNIEPTGVLVTLLILFNGLNLCYSSYIRLGGNSRDKACLVSTDD